MAMAMTLTYAKSRNSRTWQDVVKNNTVQQWEMMPEKQEEAESQEMKAKRRDREWQRQMACASKEHGVLKAGEEEMRNMRDVIPNNLTQTNVKQDVRKSVYR